jgi:hypothetical protein
VLFLLHYTIQVNGAEKCVLSLSISSQNNEVLLVFISKPRLLQSSQKDSSLSVNIHNRLTQNHQGVRDK